MWPLVLLVLLALNVAIVWHVLRALPSDEYVRPYLATIRPRGRAWDGRVGTDWQEPCNAPCYGKAVLSDDDDGHRAGCDDGGAELKTVVEVARR